MIKKSINYIKDSINKYKRIEKYADENISFNIHLSNLKRMIILSFGLIIYILANFIICMFLKEYTYTSFIYYLISIIILIFMSIFLLIITNYFFDNITLKKLKTLNILFGILLVSISYHLFLPNYINKEIIDIYTVFCFLIGIIPLLNLKQILILATILIGITSTLLLDNINAKIIFELILGFIISITISQSLYYNYKKNLINELALEDANKKLTKKLETDFLTGLLNRYGFFNRTETLILQAINNKVPISVLMLDIDYFKHYNDTFGHLEGDKCLSIIAKTIKKTVVRHTDIVTRHGGEEFLVFLYDVDIKNSIKISERIKNAVEKLNLPSGKEGKACVTVSIGLANGKIKNKKSLNKIIEQADLELYNAKKSGRNRVSYKEI